ncbi:MAG TPA: hypothetical protein VJ739_11965 [Gemmataceae bacterium]|nr:hypothetical protein [Gemmataceae bacterium]
MNLTVEAEQADNGRWLAWIPELAEARAEGTSRAEAVAHAQALALRTLAKWVESGGSAPDVIWRPSADELRRRQEVVRQTDELRARLFAIYGEMPDSTPLIREDRDR